MNAARIDTVADLLRSINVSPVRVRRREDPDWSAARAAYMGWRGFCRACGSHRHCQAYQYELPNGIGAFLWCHACDALPRMANGSRLTAVPKWLPRLPVESLPVHWARQGSWRGRCFVCAKDAPLERHHLAPRAVFGDDEAERWPTVDVCGGCHQRWHGRMNGGSRDHG